MKKKTPKPYQFAVMGSDCFLSIDGGRVSKIRIYSHMNKDFPGYSAIGETFDLGGWIYKITDVKPLCGWAEGTGYEVTGDYQNSTDIWGLSIPTIEIEDGKLKNNRSRKNKK